MAAVKRQTYKPILSGRVYDKMMACLSFRCSSTDPVLRDYYDACARWWSALSDDDEETGLIVIDMWAFSDQREAAEKAAASLPPAPKFPYSDA
jgi:hypothetical protein